MLRAIQRARVVAACRWLSPSGSEARIQRCSANGRVSAVHELLLHAECPFRLKGLHVPVCVLRLSQRSLLVLFHQPDMVSAVHSISADARPRTRRRAGYLARTHPLRWPDLLHALLARLTDHRKGRIVPARSPSRTRRQRSAVRDTPHLLSPRLELVFLTPCAPSRAISSALPAAVSTHRTAYAASTASARPARRYRRSRPTAPRLRHPAPLPARGSACGNVAAKPSCTQRHLLDRRGVTPTCSPISVSRCPGPCSPWSANSRICAFRRR